MNKKEKKRTIVKIWRDDDTRASSLTERSVTVPMVLLTLIEVAILISIAIAGMFISIEDAEPLLPGTAIAALAVNAAYFFGNVAMRNSKLAQPFEYSVGRVCVTYGILLVSILANVAVLNDWPAAWFSDLDLAGRVEITVAAVGLIGAVLQSGVSGAFDVLKWALIEEAQRRNPVARVVADVVERRNRVRA